MRRLFAGLLVVAAALLVLAGATVAAYGAFLDSQRPCPSGARLAVEPTSPGDAAVTPADALTAAQREHFVAALDGPTGVPGPVAADFPDHVRYGNQTYRVTISDPACHDPGIAFKAAGGVAVILGVVLFFAGVVGFLRE